MPIYCLNGTQSARKRSKSLIDEMIGSNNYYMSNSQQLSTASYHILLNKNNSKSVSSSSLMMSIERFRNSVQNMKETVLIPTRLNDLFHNGGEKTDMTAFSEYEFSDSTSTSEAAETNSCCNGALTNSSSETCTSQQSLVSRASIVPAASSLSLLVSQHNLYEQYKLLNLIDKILSSDALVSGQRQYNKNVIAALNSVFESDDNNNSRQNNKVLEENGKSKQLNLSDSGDVFLGKRQQPISNGHHKPLLPTTTTTTMTTATQHDGGCHRRSNSNNHLEIATNTPSPTVAIFEQNSLTNGHKALNIDLENSASIDNNCSLLKIKDKLEYHLVSLKNILALMSNSADNITQIYLEDIQCDDRFDRQIKPCEQSETSRHYYTSNNNSGGASLQN